MSTIFGIFNKTGKGIDNHKFLEFMGELDYWNPDKSSKLIQKNIAFGHHMLFTTSNSKSEELLYFDEGSNCMITADVRLDYREDLLEHLGEPDHMIQDKSDGELILLAYLKWGGLCTEFLFGDYAFVIADLDKQEIFCSRDHFGCRPFHYYDSPEQFIFSSEPKAILSVYGVPSQIDESFIVDSIMTIPIEKRKTAFSSICRLEPAHNLKVNKSRTNEELYWNLEVKDKYVNYSAEEAKEEFINCFKRAVKERCRSDFPIGIELSGGLDSSGIAALTCEVLQNTKQMPYAFTHVLKDELKDRVFPFNDEGAFSKLVVDHLKIDKHYLISGDKAKSCSRLIEEYIDQFQRPVGQIFAVMSDPLYRTAHSQHVRIMLSGLGGDHMVSSPAAGYFEELVQTSRVRSLKEQIKDKIEIQGGNYYSQVIKLVFIKWFPWIMTLYKYIFRKKDYRYFKMRESVIDKRLIKKYDLKNRLYGRNKMPTANNVRERQYRRIMQDSISDRLESTCLIAQKYHIEFRYCLLDVKLIEMYYSLPSKYKYKNGFGRYLFRDALSDFLPEEICWRRKEIFYAMPSVYNRVIKDEESIQKIIEDALRKNEFQYVDCNKLSDLFIKHKSIGQRLINGFSNRNLISAISVLLLQKWQREGKIDIGIKC